MNRDQFRNLKWGVFAHYLHGLQNGAGPQNTKGAATEWDACVEDLDCDRLAGQIADMGASYLMFTMQQGTRHFIAPNGAFERLTGLKDGCSQRDLALDLYSALSKRGLKLFLYFTGDGMPRDANPELARRFGWHGGVIAEDLVRDWAEVLREYSLRYADKVCGWWLDGVYGGFGYDAAKLSILRDAARSGNPQALISNNHYGCFKPGTGRDVFIRGEKILFGDFYQTIAPPTECCDFAAGELVCFNAYPEPDRAWDAVPHALSFLGIPKKTYAVYDGWGAGGCKYSPEYMAAYIRAFNELGGVVSVDMRLFRDGSLEDVQRRAMELVK